MKALALFLLMFVGQVAFPGGYINTGETFQQPLSREFLEETGVKVPENSWRVFHIGDSLQSNRILIFLIFSKRIAGGY